MKTTLATRIAGNEKVTLSKIETTPPEEWDKKSAKKELDALGEELRHLQELLYAAGTHSLLLVLQGMDTSGKDGAIRGVMKYVNPQGCRVESFKTPTSRELAHDFLWRVHKVAPEKVMIAVFNRSHYEDVLIVRVKKLAPPEVWKERFEAINNFEKLLAQNNTIIVKCFLHISKDEQEERLLAREAEFEKAWKLSVADWQERNFWDDYQRAYSDALSRCSSPHAPWLVVPADKKWFRNLVVAQALVAALRPHADGWAGVLQARSRASVEELKAFRAAK
jgi:PPK2 family polyphosphate:nucleotide phosphotransferase